MRPALFAAIALIACAGRPPLPASADRSDHLRSALAAAEDDVQRAMLREELAKYELERARAAHTIFAYRRFLAEFGSSGPSATTARSLLESLRFNEAARVSTRAGWEEFLDEHPRGESAIEARARLGALEIAEARATTDLPAIRRVLARYPEHPDRALLVAREDELAWRAASTSGLDDLDGYLAGHPAGRFRAEAVQRREALELAGLLESEDLARARLRASQGDAGPLQRATLAAIRLRLALRSLDPAELTTLATDPAVSEAAPAVRNQAQSMLESFTRAPLTTAVLDALAAARPGAGLRPRDQLLKLLGAADPLEREAVVRELVDWSDVRDVDSLLEAVESRYVGVRLAAVAGLGTLVAALPPAIVRPVLQEREQVALASAQSGPPWRRIAALREASGRADAALSAWREVLRHDPNDLAARARVLALDTATIDRVSRGAAARELAQAAVAFGDDRWLTPQDRDLPAESRRDGPGVLVGLRADVTVLRQLCTALDLAAVGRGALAALRTEAAPSERELLGLALADADRALSRLGARRAELEQDARRADRAYVMCGTDLATPRLAAARAGRVDALRRLASLGDRRVLPAVESFRYTPAPEVRAAVAEAERVLALAPPEPAAPLPAVPLAPEPKPLPKPARRR